MKFDLTDKQGRDDLASWFHKDGPRELPLQIWLKTTEGTVNRKRSPPTAHRPTRGDGVNLVGYAHGDLGIGEDLRMVARSLDAVGIPYAIIDRSAHLQGSTDNRSLAGRIDDDCPFDVTLLCLTGFDAADHLLTDGRGFDDRAVIGYWPWELPSWPSDWRAAYDLVDELWAGSTFTARAFEADAPVPVLHLPSAVDCDADTLSRAALGLPESRFLFLYVFDAHSYLQRKNPIAAVLAFQRAFPDSSAPVGLVLKVMNADSRDPQWQSVQEAIAGDARIQIVSRTLSRGAVLALIGRCDCYLSLHRSEGFGRTIAEAMLLGRPVIATDWSGSHELVTAETAMPVRAEVIPVADGDYPWGAGSQWAEPDLEFAAWCLRRMVEDDALRMRLGAAGQAHVRANHHPRVIGQGYAARLRQRRAKPLG